MLRRLKTIRLGAWLGVWALAVQIYLPIHLVHMVETGSGTAIAAPIAHHYPSNIHAVAAPAHHDAPAHGEHSDAHAHCPLCSMLHGSVAATLPDSIGPQHPTLHSIAATALPQSRELASASPASYASRAPPMSLG